MAATAPERESSAGLEAGALQGSKRALLEVLELAIPPAWSRCFHSGDWTRLTDGLTNFARLNSCPWIVSWLKSFDLGLLVLLQDPAAPLQDYRATLESVLALPSAPRDLEQHPDFLLEPTLLVQLPWSAALLQQWLATALMEVTRFQTLAAELRLWPMEEEHAVLASQLLNLVKICKDRLVLGLALLARDVTSHPAVHRDTPHLLLDQAVLSAVPVLRFLLHGEARTLVNRLKHLAFSAPHSLLPALRSVGTAESGPTSLLCSHYFHPFYWLGHQSAPPFPPVQSGLLDSLVEQLKENAGLDPDSLPLDSSFQLENGVVTRDASLYESSELAHFKGSGEESGEMSPRLSSLVAQLKQGPASLLRALLVGTAEKLVRYEEVRDQAGLSYSRGVTPTLTCDLSNKQDTTPCELSNKQDTTPCELTGMRRTLKRVWVETRVANRSWLLKQFPPEWPRDFKSAAAEEGELYETIMRSADPDKLKHAITKLYGGAIIYSHQQMFPLHDQKIRSEPMVQIYDTACLPLIYLKTACSADPNTLRGCYVRLVMMLAFRCHLSDFEPLLLKEFIEHEEFSRTVCPTDSTSLRKASADLRLLQDEAFLHKDFLFFLNDVFEFEKTLISYAKAQSDWTLCFSDPEKKIRNKCEMLLCFFHHNFMPTNIALKKMFNHNLIDKSQYKPEFEKLFKLADKVNELILDVYFAGYVYPELENLPSLKLLREKRSTMSNCYILLVLNILSLKRNKLEEGKDHRVWVHKFQSCVCALISDVLNKISAAKLKKLRNMKDCFEGYKGDNLCKILKVESVPVNEARRFLEDGHFENYCFALVPAIFEKVQNEEPEADLSSKVEEMRLDPASGGAVRLCLCCKRPEDAEHVFRGDFCSAQCRDKWRAREEKRCRFCGRYQNRSGEKFLRCGGRVFCGAQCRDQWRANGGRPCEDAGERRDCSHCGRAQRDGEQFSKCPECEKDAQFPAPNFYCSVQCRDTWWGLEHQAQHLEFELGLPWWDSPN